VLGGAGGAVRGADPPPPPSKEFRRVCTGLRNWKNDQGPTKTVEPQIIR
jgi:hypothetical protein